MRARPRLANSVLARAEAYREGLLFGLTVPAIDEHPLDTVQPPAAPAPEIAAGVDAEVTAEQAQGGTALGVMLDQSAEVL